MEKNSNNWTRKNPISESGELLNYRNYRTNEMVSISEEYIQALSEKMPKEILKDTTINNIADYLIKKGIPRSSYYYLKDKHPKLEASHDICLTIIGARKEKYLKTNPHAIMFVMPYYDPHVYEKMAKFHADLKNQQQNEDEKVKYIVLPNAGCKCHKQEKE